MVVLVVIVAAVVVFGLIQKQGRPPGGPTGPAGGPPSFGELGYKSEIPKDATLTPPKLEAPASANPDLQTKIRFFDLKATRNGFEPESFVVNRGDAVQFDFTAVDNDYDLGFPYLGAYFNVIRQGEMRRLPFDVSLPGTFIFQCRDYCPSGKIIKGQLIVLP